MKDPATTVCIGISVVAFLVSLTCFKVVPAASVGVVTTLGIAADEPLVPGMYFIKPWSSISVISTKTSLLEQANHVPTKEGVTVELDVALLYHVDTNSARELFLTLGEKYQSVLIEPELASAVRGLTSEADASALYTSGRAEMQTKLHAELSTVLSKRGIIVESVLLKGVVLPDMLKAAIEKKAQGEQEAARMQFVIAKEKQESERKEIEAQGIAAFQKIVSEGISPELLAWKGIEVTHEIATSSNAKVIMVGNTRDSLPVIFGDQSALAAAGAAKQ